MDKQNKVKTSFTLSPTINNLIEILSKKLEISKTAVIMLAVRWFAKQENVEIEENED